MRGDTNCLLNFVKDQVFLECKTKNLPKLLLSLITTCVSSTQYYFEPIKATMKRHGDWFHIIEIVYESLKSNEEQQFYNLGNL